ncbi:MAG: DUF4492 domain-containing protein [Bacteroidaceae bacterium]|nr:DUF4492 domain-containing protein [Bacteroidaceae bacterium]
MKDLIVKIWRFYVDGFKSMTIGKTLWLLIFIKLFIMFCILRVFFFPNFLNSVTDDDSQKDDYVSSQIINRSITDPAE